MKEKIINFFKKWGIFIVWIIALIVAFVMIACCLMAASKCAFVGLLGTLGSFVVIMICVKSIMDEWKKLRPANRRK